MNSERQPMPLTSTVMGVPTGPLSGVIFTVMSIEKPAWVNMRSGCCSTMSCTKPKSSGVTNLAVSRPAASDLTLAIS